LIGGNSYLSGDDSVDLKQLYQADSLGYSLIIRKKRDRGQPITGIERNLETFLNHPVPINLYMSPKKAQAFPAHFDTHDVFILPI